MKMDVLENDYQEFLSKTISYYFLFMKVLITLFSDL